MTAPSVPVVSEERLRELRADLVCIAKTYPDPYGDVLKVIDELLSRRAADAQWVWWGDGCATPEDGQYWVLWEGAVSKRREVRLMHACLWNDCVKAYFTKRHQPPPPPPTTTTAEDGEGK